MAEFFNHSLKILSQLNKNNILIKITLKIKHMLNFNSNSASRARLQPKKSNLYFNRKITTFNIPTVLNKFFNLQSDLIQPKIAYIALNSKTLNLIH